MAYKFDYDKPIYLQLIQLFMIKIYTKQWRIEQKIPSVRELGSLYGVNPNTVQKALSILEEQGVLRSERTAGRFVCDDAAKFNQMKQQYISELSVNYLNEVGVVVDDFSDIVKILERNWNHVKN